MKKKIMWTTVVLIILAMLATPVLAIGPQKANGNPNVVTEISSDGNSVTEIWLHSGTMNEWINPGIPHSSGHVQLLDASKGNKNAAAAIMIPPIDIFFNENTWFYYTSAQLQTLFAVAGLNLPNAYPQGVYIRIVFVG